MTERIVHCVTKYYLLNNHGFLVTMLKELCTPKSYQDLLAFLYTSFSLFGGCVDIMAVLVQSLMYKLKALTENQMAQIQLELEFA